MCFALIGPLVITRRTWTWTLITACWPRPFRTETDVVKTKEESKPKAMIKAYLTAKGKLKIQNAFPDPGNASLGLLTKKIYQQNFFFQTKNICRPNFSFRPKFFSDQKNVWQKKFLTIFFPTINFFWQFFFLQPKKISDQKYVRPNSFSNQPNWLWHNSKLT